MVNNKFYIFEKTFFLGVLVAVLSGFWYFETSLIIKIIATILVVVGLIVAFRRKKTDKSDVLSSRFEMLSLMLIYLGVFCLYNFIYDINFPIYIVMVMLLLLVVTVSFVMFSLEQTGEMLNQEVFLSAVLITGLLLVEVFLSLYFWPVNIEIKSLILVLIFYQTTELIYLYVRSMLRLSKIIGFVIVNLLVLAVIFWSMWPKS